MAKLIDGNIHIDDEASQALNDTDKALKKLSDKIGKVLKRVEALNGELGKLKGNSAALRDIDALGRAEHARKMEQIQIKGLGVSSRDTERAALAMEVSDRKKRNAIEVSNHQLNNKIKFENEKLLIKERQDQKKELQRLVSNIKTGDGWDEVDKEATRLAKMTAWQKKMERWQKRGGRLAPLWGSLGKASSGMDAIRRPSLVSEGLAGSMKNFGLFGKSAIGVAGGRLAGGMLFGATGANIGGMIGGAAMGGPIGIALGAIAIGLRAGFDKLATKVQEITGILKEIASERAFESTSLRRKMQMSSEMFGVNPTDVEGIDKKIYALRDWEQEAYKRGLAGRDITTSAIDWLHLLGTKDSGGTFENEKEAFDFASALSSIAKMNGLSEAEYETVRYQGMQILSKGYADILDIKPLLNSAPGFVRDLLQQTGMSRKELLESGRGRTFTAEKFKQALLNVQDYYETLSMRASSRTTEQQDEAAKNIIGRAAVWDEMYEKEKAASNTKVTNAVIEGELMNDIKESWYQMWSDENDAEDGIVKKVKFEKEMTQLIWKGVMDIYTGFILVKNVVDIVINSVVFLFEQIPALFSSAFQILSGGILWAFGSVFAALGDKLGIDSLKEWGESLNPNSQKNRDAEMAKEGGKALADAVYETYQKGGDSAVREKFPGLMENAVRMASMSKGTVSEQTTAGRIVSALGAGLTALGPAGVPAGMLLSKIGAAGAKTTTNTFTPEGRSVSDYMFYEQQKDKAIQLYRDKDQMEKIFTDNFGELMGRNAAGDISATGLVNTGATMSGVNTSSAAVSQQTYADYLKLSGKSSADYTFQAGAKRTLFAPWEKFRKSTSQDIDDMKRAVERREKAFKESDKEYQNVKAPYTDKAIGALNNTVKGDGSKTGEILDVLKEIAGVTVINKVTRVRPDVVFNYGSYGRNGKAEGPNLKTIGDGTPQDVQFAKAVTNEILNLIDNEEPGFEQSVNDMPSMAYA